ncbi:GNAT family N-acyltransferase [Halomonas sp. AOP27-A1-34]|uniref:GNAT family N-acyltransferase n=1 Tax=Halomonas sp. AOP27-A1-34 TaxID=3457708 RepID=UPI0040348628
MEKNQQKENSSTTAYDFFASFKNDFNFKIAITDIEKRRIYKLRHDVYCQEIGYQAPESSSNNLELDIHDAHSIHCLIEHRRSGLAAGCLRLVLPAPCTDDNIKRLPLQDFGEQHLPHKTLHPAKCPITVFVKYHVLLLPGRFAIKPLNMRRWTSMISTINLLMQKEKHFA